MDHSITIGLDLAKSVFQLHGVDAEGRVVVRRRLRRSQVPGYFRGLGPCLVGMEACSGAHNWARDLSALGHEVRLMPPAYVKPYVKRGKTDGETGPWPQTRLRRPVERRRGHLRGGHPPDDAVRAGQARRTSGSAARSQGAGLPAPAADSDGERDPRASVGIRHRRGERHPQPGPTTGAAQDVPEAARPALELLADQLRELEERIEKATARITARGGDTLLTFKRR